MRINDAKLRVLSIVLAIGLATGAVSCNRRSSEPVGTRHHLKGKVVSLDKQSGTVTVDHEDIPGFMSAMTMPYVVKPVSQLGQLAPGDAITADVVLGESGYWLDNITVAEHANARPGRKTGP